MPKLVVDPTRRERSRQETPMEKASGSGTAVIQTPEERLEEQLALLREFREILERSWERNKDLDPDEVMRIVTEEVEAVRQERYEQEQREAQGGR